MWWCILFLSIGSIAANEMEDLSDYDTYTADGDCAIYEYFFPIHDDTIRFHVSSPMSASIALTTGPHDSNPMYEVLFGVDEVFFVVIRLNQEVNTTPLTNIGYGLFPMVYSKFWIKLLYENNNESKNYDGWSKDLRMLNITVGREGQVEPFLTYSSPTTFDIKFFGIGSLESKAKWKISETALIPHRKTIYFVTPYQESDIVEQRYPKCFLLTENYVQFQVKAQKHAMVVLAENNNSNPIVEIQLGLNLYDSSCPIRKINTNEVSSSNKLRYDIYSGFWIYLVPVHNTTHSTITTTTIQVGRRNESKPFMVWLDPKPFTVKYYCFATPALEHDGKWLIKEGNKPPVYKGLKYVETQNREEIYYDKFFKLKGKSKIHLSIRSGYDASVAFFMYPLDSIQKYQIQIQATESRVHLEKRYDFDSLIYRNTLEEKEYHNFWIEYNKTLESNDNHYIKLCVTYENEQNSIKCVSYMDMGFEIEYFSVASIGKDGSGFWIIEDSLVDEDNRIIEKKVETGNKSNIPTFFRIYSNVISFKVRAPGNAIIDLTTNKETDNNTIQIELGCWGCLSGSEKYGSLMRKNGKVLTAGGNTDFTIVTSEYRSYLVKINNITTSNGTALSIGLFQEGRIEPYLMWTDPNPYLINYIGVSSSDRRVAFWVVKVKAKDPKQITIDNEDFYTTGDGLIKYFKLNSQTAKFKVHCLTAVNITLTHKKTLNSTLPSNHIQINLLGPKSDDNETPGGTITRDGIIKARIDSIILFKNAFAHLWIKWIYKMSNEKMILNIHFGREGESEPLLKWTDEDPFENITYIGFSSIEKEHIATWSVPLETS